MIIVGIGAALGAVIRVYLSQFNRGFPWVTLLINSIGSLLLGCLVHYEHLFLLFGTGMMGGLTTFSTFAVESVTLWQTKRSAAIAYITVSVVLPLTAFSIGMLIL